MKNTFFILLILFVTFLSYYSCEKNEDVIPPTLTVLPDDTINAVAGESVEFNISISGETYLSSMIIKTYLNSSLINSITDTFGDIKTKDYIQSIPIHPNSLPGETLLIHFLLIEGSVGSATQERLINIINK